MKKDLIVELVGWYGAVAILMGYTLNTFNVLDSSSIFYQVLNLTGAIGIVVVSISKGAKQPAVLNFVWAVIALLAIASIVLGL